eukprot:195068-Pyramimonas_sp.AAC.1
MASFAAAMVELGPAERMVPMVMPSFPPALSFIRPMARSTSGREGVLPKSCWTGPWGGRKASSSGGISKGSFPIVSACAAIVSGGKSI